MIQIPKIKKESFPWRKPTWIKVAKYISVFIAAIILICIMIFIFFPDKIINTFLKDRITKSFNDAYPEYSIQLGEMHYNIWKNRVACDSITLKAIDSTFAGKVTSLSVCGINWMKLILQKDFSPNTITSLVLDAQNIEMSFLSSHDELRLKMLHISMSDSLMTVDSVKYYSPIDDEQFFANSPFRQTRFQLDIPGVEIMGLDYLSFFRGNLYKAQKIKIHDIFADILVNMDKPYNKNSPNPQMPNEALSSMKEIIKIDSVDIINGRLKYCERYEVGAKPGVITFDKLNVSIDGISNHTATPDTAVINGEGVFMNSGVMKLLMKIPLSSTDFSLRYSGSLTTMDLTKLNSFIEAGEHRRIKSGTIQSSIFNIDVNSGRANGTLRVAYKDLSIALLNEDTGSESGIFNRILSFFGKVFIIRGTNMPDEKGLMKLGDIKYIRKPDDNFLQFMWFALRGGVGDVVGFPPENIPDK